MRITLVGPTHPFKGGVALHTTLLAHELAARGHNPTIISWRRQYPTWLYPGVQTVSEPEYPPFPATERVLDWSRPASWLRAARRMSGADLVIFVHVTSIQAPAYAAMAKIVRRRGGTVAVLCHNVLPHERRSFDVRANRRLFGRADALVVHSPDEADLARTLTAAPVHVTRLPPFLASEFVETRPQAGVHRRLLFFGLVRPYKGVDVAIGALARITEPEVRLRIAGEFWGGTSELEKLSSELGVRDRVEFIDGYIPAAEAPSLFADVDAAVLPYRSSTGSQAVWLSFQMGVPVLATSAGLLAADVTPGVDGLIAEPDSVEDLARIIGEFYLGETPTSMRDAVRPVDPKPHWDAYVRTLERAAREREPG